MWCIDAVFISTICKKLGAWDLCKFAELKLQFMRGSQNLISPIWELEKNGGEIIKMNMDLFCVTETLMWK